MILLPPNYMRNVVTISFSNSLANIPYVSEMNHASLKLFILVLFLLIPDTLVGGYEGWALGSAACAS